MNEEIMSDTPLSERLRPDVEAAPWVIKELKMLEAENAALREEAEKMVKRIAGAETRAAGLMQSAP